MAAASPRSPSRRNRRQTLGARCRYVILATEPADARNEKQTIAWFSLPPELFIALIFHRLLLRRVLDDDKLLLVRVVAVFLVVRQHRKPDAVGLALLDDHVHELF